ncbi:MAG: hypothetical protein LUD25_00860 [Coriobacteriaceae bacterium]|nr:hypothetical protein [Coriobacteriaceae bacterium]
MESSHNITDSLQSVANSHVTRRGFVALSAATAASLAALSGCGADEAERTGTLADLEVNNPDDMSSLVIDENAWNYDSSSDAYWQVGIVYCAYPAASDYESMGVFVPGAYFNATQNEDGTYTCTVNTEGAVGDYTAENAPYVLPVNTAGYSAQEAPTGFGGRDVSTFLEAGMIYLDAGCRGRDNGENPDGSTYDGGAPWGATDLKAAVRCLRYNAARLPGNTEYVFSFGHSGGGAQSSLMGATGDSDLYQPYLEAIGAAMKDDEDNYISDALYGSMCWCPITCLDCADLAYEWMMGQYTDSGTRADGTWTAALSEDMAASFASYINGAGFVDADGKALTLEESDNHIYASGSYYDHVLGVINDSLNNFLSDTEFPYTPSSDMGGGMPGGGGMGGTPSGDMGGDAQGDAGGETNDNNSQANLKLVAGDTDDNAGGQGGPGGGQGDIDDLMPERGEGNGDTGENGGDMQGGGPGGDMQGGDMQGGGPGGDMQGGDMQGGGPGGDMQGGDMQGGGMQGGNGGPDAGMSMDSSTTYETAEDYIASLNGDNDWIAYNADANTAVVKNIARFIKACKPASKDVGAFDDLNRSQAENKVFGNGEENALHFDAYMASLLADNAERYATCSDYDDSYVSAYAGDLDNVDALGVASDIRQNMYNPVYYAGSGFEGYKTANVAPHWRIRTGIEQGDTSVTTEINLALALQSNSDVKTVDFATVWGQGHTTAERSGDSNENFISWIADCLG